VHKLTAVDSDYAVFVLFPDYIDGNLVNVLFLKGSVECVYNLKIN